MANIDRLYRGVVIQNNDPSTTGRVKVFVPGVNITQIKNWNQKKEEDKYFKVPGKNTNTALTPEVLQEQKEKLFWAEVMLPIVGMSAPGYYHAPEDTYYIGNDSDYLSQSGNKTAEFFRQDAEEAERRRNDPPRNPSYGIQPRTDILLNALQCGQKYCINSGCDNGASVPSIWKDNNGPLNPVTSQLPRVYTPTILELDAEDDDNTAVVAVELNIFDPEILLDGKPVSRNNPIFNQECFISPDTGNLLFQPPIIFEEADGFATESYESLPVSLTINGKKSLTDAFKLDSSNGTTITYKNKNVQVIVPKTNVSSIKIKHNKNRFDFNRIAALLPLLASLANNILMPRAPAPNGQQMPTRGGGGGEVFNNVTTNLLPSNVRKDMHIGGANNESRQTVNKGRKPLNDPNNTKGANLVGTGGQVHRGPMRSPDYNNDWKGLIVIPGVGAHVGVRFENGDVNYPIVVGTFAAQANYKGIYEKR